MKINENVTINVNSLKAAKVTKEEFFNLMVEKVLDYEKKEFEEWEHKYHENLESLLTYHGYNESALVEIFHGKKFYSPLLFSECFGIMLGMFCHCGNNVDFDYENYECVDFYNSDYYIEADQLNEDLYMSGDYGLHTSPDGLTYIAFSAGGDWEYPVMSIFYLTPEKEFMVYTPLKGNPVNLSTMMPFGNEEDHDEWDGYEDYADMIVKTTGIEDFRNAPHEDLCLEDIFQTIEVVEC